MQIYKLIFIKSDSQLLIFKNTLDYLLHAAINHNGHISKFSCVKTFVVQILIIIYIYIYGNTNSNTPFIMFTTISTTESGSLKTKTKTHVCQKQVPGKQEECKPDS